MVTKLRPGRIGVGRVGGGIRVNSARPVIPRALDNRAVLSPSDKITVFTDPYNGSSGREVDLRDFAFHVKRQGVGPMDGQIVLSDYQSSMSRWVLGLVYEDTSDELYLIETAGRGHDPDYTKVTVRKTQDGGDTWTGMKTIFSDESNLKVRAGAFAKITSSRIAGIIVTGDNVTRKVWYGYTDDKFVTVTWTEITSSMTLGNHFPFGMLVPWPAAAGGHDTDGWQVTSYAGTSTDVKVIRTRDGGTTWEDAVLKTSTGLPGTAQEAFIVQLPDGRWMLLTRTAAAGNVWASVADEGMETWGDWIDTGVPLGSNPVHVIIEDGFLHLNIFYREGFTNSVEDNCLVSFTARADEVGDDPTLLGSAPQRIIACLPSRAIGYPFSVQRGEGGAWYHVFKVMEDGSTVDGAGSALCIIRQIPGAVLGLHSGVQAKQWIENPTFTSWPKGDSVSTGGTTDVLGAGRWILHPSGTTTLTMAKTLLPDNVRYCLPWHAVYGCTITSSGGSDFGGIFQKWLGDDAGPVGVALTDRQRMTLRLYGWGAFPADVTYRTSLAINGTECIRNTISRTIPIPQGVSGEAAWVTEIELRTDSLDTLGIAEDAITSVTFNLAPETNGDYTIKLAGVFLYTGVPPMEIYPPTIAETDAAVARYYERFGTAASQLVAPGWARTAAAGWCALHYSKKVTTPTLAISAASDFHMQAGGSSFVASAIALNNATRNRARLAVTTSGMTTGHGAALEVVGSPSATPYLEITCGA